ncbi:hypothetical protein MetMK1DRAFT_00031030 [Metallosphaera yellowstonensis MK1]|jgi:hypothetical protein|uniref:Uncharacterized protein n=2 Tax=Metallosphaera TaxID=41980 RepID=H2C934_9CREN|nr:hypothetical protein MetMK1DRAFT_00031030 [Metallosphaera yellowstonensis MK1]
MNAYIPPVVYNLVGNKKIVLDIEDPRMYVEIFKRLRSLGVDVGSAEGTGDQVFKLKGSEESVRSVVNRLYLASKGKEAFNELLIGIDTNKDRLTVVILADGQIFETKELRIEETTRYLEEVISEYPHRRLRIGVGVGNLHGRQVYEMLRKEIPFVKMVDERGTSSRNPYIEVKDRDVRAAYAIAIRSAI